MNKKVVISLILAIIVIGGWFIWYKPLPKSSVIQSSTPEERKRMLSRNPFLLPEASTKGATEVALPVDLQELLLESPQALHVLTATYPNNKVGYSVEMSVSGSNLLSLMTFYTKLGYQDWK